MTEGQRVLILEARFYEDIADQLVAGAVGALDAAGASHERISVPGAFELPAALAMAIESGRYDGFVALGCVSGQTSHTSMSAAVRARARRACGRHRIALGFGVVTRPKTASRPGSGRRRTGRTRAPTPPRRASR